MRQPSWLDQRRHGHGVVGFALCAPIVVLLFVLLVQSALYVHARTVVFGAAHEGAEAASAEGASLADGVSRTQVVLAAGLGQYARGLVIAPQETDDVVIIDVSGSMGVLHVSTDPKATIGLPLHARARSVRERVPGQVSGG